MAGVPIEFVYSDKYLGISVDARLSFKPRVENLIKNFKVKLAFLMLN